MAIAVDLEGCCAVSIVYELFVYRHPRQTAQERIGQTYQNIRAAMLEDARSQMESDHLGIQKVYIATTNSQEQPEAEEALKRLGFKKSFSFDSHNPDVPKRGLKFWKRMGVPRDLYNELRREQQRDFGND